MRTLVLIALSSAALAGCSVAGFELERASARVIQPTPYPDSVKISDVHRDGLGRPRSWVASTRTGVYDCSQEPEEKTAICAKRDSLRNQ